MMTSSLITCLAPVSTDAEGVLVDVSTNDGADFTASGIEFLYEAAATVESVTPSKGRSGSTGQAVTIVGQHFTKTGDLSCLFGVNGTVRGRYMSSTMVTCVAPSRGAGTVSVKVSNNGVDAGTGRVGFTYGTAGSISSIEPTSGLMKGGTVVTVTGSNLDGGAIRTECIFGAETVSGSLRNGSLVVCTAPGSTSSEVTVALAQDGKRLDGIVSLQYLEAPTIAGISPSRGPASGGVVVSVRGANLRGDGLVCRFGGKTVSGAGARLVTSTLVACIAPVYVGLDGKVLMEVSVNHGVDFSTDGKEFVYGAVSVVEGLRPSQVMGGET